MAETNPYFSLVTGGAASAASANPYDSLAASEGAVNTSGRLSMMQVADKNPDVEARLQDLAKQYSVPPETIRLDQKGYESRAKIDALDYDTLARDFPTTASMVGHPEKAAISYDDTDNMSAIEKGVRFLSNSGKAIASALPQFNASAWAIGQAALDTYALGAQKIAQQVSQSQFLPAPARLLGTAGDQAVAPLTNEAIRMRQIQEGYAKDLTPQAKSVLESGYYSGLQSLGQMALAIPAAFTGNAGPAIGVLSAVTGGQAYGEARDKGIPTGVALPFAASQAAIEYATEMIPVANFVGDLKVGAPLWKMLTNQVLSEIPGEQVATVLQDLNEWAVLNPEKPFKSYLEERPSAAAQTLVATIVAAGGASGAARGASMAVNRLRARNSEAEAATINATVLTELNDLAANSKLRERSPEAFAQFVREAAADGPVQDVFIDAAALAQSGVDLAALAKASPSVAAQLADPAAAVGAIRIPIDEYATNIAGTDMAGALFQHLKTDPAGMTVAEGEAFMKDRAGALKTEVEAIMGEQEQATAFAESRARVEQQVADELAKTGRFTPDVNASYAKMMAAFYGTQAARLGISPEEMALRYPLEIRSTLGDPTMQRLDQGPAATPTERRDAARAKGIEIVETEDGFDAMLDGKRIGRLRDNLPRGAAEQLGENANVSIVKVDKDQAGKGIGAALYEAFFEKHGGRVQPSGQTTADAWRVWKRNYPEKVAEFVQQEAQRIRDGANERLVIGNITDPEVAQAVTEAAHGDAAQLNQSAADQTQTPEFKQWFGESKVVDANGNPLVVYHGRSGDFTEFRTQGQGKTTGSGAFFTSSPAVAATYSGGTGNAGNIAPVYLSIQNPLRVDAMGQNWNVLGKKTTLDMPAVETPDTEEALLAELEDRAPNPDATIKRKAKKTTLGKQFPREFNYSDGFSTDEIAAWARTQGYDGVIFTNVKDRGPTGQFHTEEASQPSDLYVAFSPEQVKSAIGNRGTFSPNDPSILNQSGEGMRGGYSGVNVEGFTTPSIITLLQHADLSTFLHESGHYYLEVLADLARQPDAPKEITDDMQAVLDWFGVDSLKTWTDMSLEEKRESHEKWARGFESYLFEGKSPNSELGGIFSRFRSWLLNIYKAVQSLNAEITPEIRSVFDRMLASADAIAEAQSTAGMLPLFDSAQAAGMTEQEWEGYQRLGLEAQQDAQDGLEKRSLRDVKWLDNARSRVMKELQKGADEKRAAIRDEVAADVYATPVYGAMQFLRRGLTTMDGEQVKVDGAHKLSIDALQELYPESDAWKKLGYGKYGMLAKENGLHPDIVAQMFGFTSGDQLLNAILSAKPVNEVINELTDERMLQRYGEMSDPAAIARAADEAVHNEARARFVTTEANALAKATGSPKILAAAARNFANDIVARLRVRDLRPSQYVRAEGKAAKAARDAMKEGDLQTAAVQKRNQLINNYAARAALTAQNEVDAAVRYLKKFDSEGVRKNVNIDYREQIDALLERYDLRTGQSLRSIDRRKSLADWVKQQEDKGLTPVIDPALLDEAARKSYKDMTVEELRGLRDAVKNIEHLGRLKNKMLTAKDQRDFDDVADAVQASIVDNATGIVPERRASDRGFLVQPRALFRKFVASHRKFASQVRQFDGWKDGGTAWEYMVRNMNDAGDFQAVQNEKATVALSDIFRPLLEGRSLGVKTFFPQIGKSFTHEERIGIALNMGNEVNRERVLSGENLSPGQLQAILDTITEKEWGIVQQIWDYLDTFRPQIAAKERRISGVEPEWVEAQPVVTRFGTYRGGYYPIAYDPLRSTRSEADTEAQVARQMQQGMYTRAQTRRGHLKERVESTGRPLRYDLNVVGEHVQQVIHDLAWQEYLIDTNRLLGDDGIDNAIRTHYGPETLKNMRDLMTDIAVGNVQATTALDNIMNHLRTGATITGLGFRFTTSLMQPLGLTQSMVRIGPKWVARGISHWGAGVLGLEKGTREMYEMSDFMRLRGKTMQREINEIQNRVRGLENASPTTAAGLLSRLSPAAGEKLQASYFYFIQKAQMIADVPTWWGAYEKAMSQPDMSEDKAIALADQAVRDSQGGGQIGDLAAIQRGGSGQKLFTNFYSFFNTTYQLTREVFGRTNFKSPKDVAFLTADLALLYMVPSILGTLMKAALKGEDDWDKIGKDVLADLLGYVTGTMVGVREISAAIQAAVGSGPGDYTGPASVRFFADLAKFAKQAQQGEADAAFWKSLNSVGGTLFHYPAGQINATVQGINALVDGKTENPGAVLVGAPQR